MKILLWLGFSFLSSPILSGLAVAVIVVCLLVTRKMGRNFRVKWRIGVIGLTIVVLLAIGGWKTMRFLSHVVDPKAYEAVELGMTKEQVANLLGEPSDKNLDIWRYDKPGVFEFVEIYFDESGRVSLKHFDR